MKKLLFAALFLILNSTVHALGLNDLSVLVPLPKLDQYQQMLSPYEQGEKGQLLSKSVFNRFFNLVVDKKNEEIWNTQLKVVAIRIDPCFTENDQQDCRRQIRLVWQPVFTQNNELTTRDASLHSFYEFDEKEFSKILKDWMVWSKTKNSLPLTIHPLLQQEGLSGKHWSELRSLILKHCGEQNLVRMTSMNVMGSAQLWLFSGYDIERNGTVREIQIPRIQSTTQSITQSSFDIRNFWGAINPAPNEDFEFNFLIEDSMFFKKQSSEVEVRKAISSFLKFENPKKTNTGNLDCASCHLSNMAHQWIELNYPQIDMANEFSDVRYQEAGNLENVTKHKVNPNQFRIFGYFENKPVISQRIINETNEVAKHFQIHAE